MAAAQFLRVADESRQAVTIYVDGEPLRTLEGDTLLAALLLHGHVVRHSEFGDGPRAGFCLMGACQDCWTLAESGARMRACTTLVREGLRVRTRSPE